MSQIVEELNFAAVRGRSFMTSAFFWQFRTALPPPPCQQMSDFYGLPPPPCQHVSDFYNPKNRNLTFKIVFFGDLKMMIF